jgi:AcrR family transcriptional regulator
MPRPRWNHLDPEKQALIRQTTLQELGEFGVDGASYNRIIKKSGVSKGAMYYYFDDRNDLFHTALLHMVDELIGSYPRPEHPPTHPEEFWVVARSVLRHGVHWFHAHPIEAKVVLQLGPTARDSLPEKYRTPERQVAALFLQILALAQRIGAVRTDLPFPFLMELVLGVQRTCDRWLILHANEPEGVLEEKITLVLDILQRLVEPR